MSLFSKIAGRNLTEDEKIDKWIVEVIGRAKVPIWPRPTNFIRALERYAGNGQDPTDLLDDLPRSPSKVTRATMLHFAANWATIQPATNQDAIVAWLVANALEDFNKLVKSNKMAGPMIDAVLVELGANGTANQKKATIEAIAAGTTKLGEDLGKLDSKRDRYSSLRRDTAYGLVEQGTELLRASRHLMSSVPAVEPPVSAGNAAQRQLMDTVLDFATQSRDVVNGLLCRPSERILYGGVELTTAGLQPHIAQTDDVALKARRQAALAELALLGTDARAGFGANWGPVRTQRLDEEVSRSSHEDKYSDTDVKCPLRARVIEKMARTMTVPGTIPPTTLGDHAVLNNGSRPGVKQEMYQTTSDILDAYVSSSVKAFQKVCQALGIVHADYPSLVADFEAGYPNFVTPFFAKGSNDTRWNNAAGPTQIRRDAFVDGTARARNSALSEANDTLDRMNDMVGRLTNDITDLAGQFRTDVLAGLTLANPTVANIKKIHVTGSDPHKRGGRVVIMTIEDDNGVERKVVYKPRSAAMDKHIVELGATIDGWFPPDPNVKFGDYHLTDDTAGYSWIECIDRQDQANETLNGAPEVKGYMTSLGRTLALSMLTSSEDIHHGNVMVHDGTPFLTDLEMGNSMKSWDEIPGFDPGSGGFDTTQVDGATRTKLAKTLYSQTYWTPEKNSEVARDEYYSPSTHFPNPDMPIMQPAKGTRSGGFHPMTTTENGVTIDDGNGPQKFPGDRNLFKEPVYAWEYLKGVLGPFAKMKPGVAGASAHTGALDQGLQGLGGGPDSYRFHVLVTATQLTWRRVYLEHVAQGGAFDMIWRLDGDDTKTVAQAVLDWCTAHVHAGHYLAPIRLTGPTVADQWKAYFKGQLLENKQGHNDPAGTAYSEANHGLLIDTFGAELIRRDVFWSEGRVGDRNLYGAGGGLLKANFFPKDYSATLANPVHQRVSAQQVMLDCFCRPQDDPNQGAFDNGGVAGQLAKWREFATGVLEAAFDKVATGGGLDHPNNGHHYDNTTMNVLLADLEAVL